MTLTPVQALLLTAAGLAAVFVGVWIAVSFGVALTVVGVAVAAFGYLGVDVARPSEEGDR